MWKKLLGRIRDEKGYVLAIALMVMIALTVLGMTALMFSTMGIDMAGGERQANEALYAADAGLNVSLNVLAEAFRERESWEAEAGGCDPGTGDDPGGRGVILCRFEEDGETVVERLLNRPLVGGDATYSVWVSQNLKNVLGTGPTTVIRVISIGEAGEAQKQIESEVYFSPVPPPETGGKNVTPENWNMVKVLLTGEQKAELRESIKTGLQAP